MQKIKARLRIWSLIEKKICKRVDEAKNQMILIKELVSTKQQAEIDRRTNLD